MIRILVLVFLFFIFHSLSAALAAAPTNDICSGAENIPGAGPFPYFTGFTDITDATTNGDPVLPSCLTTGISHSIWYTFTPSASRQYTISASTDSGSTAIDTDIGIYTSAGGCAGPFTEYACNEFEADLQAAISTNFVANTTYYIVVWSGVIDTMPTPPNSLVRLRVSTPVVPTNDTCNGAEIIPAGGPFPHFTAVTDTTLATTTGDPTVSGCASTATRGIWYKFTPATAGPYAFSTCATDTTNTTILDTFMAIYTSASGCSGPFTQLACNDNSPCGSRAAITTSLNSGTTYFIVVWEPGDEPVTLGESSLQLRVARISAPTVTTFAATVFTTTTRATLNGFVNPNGASTRAWFEWSTNSYSTTNTTTLQSPGATNNATNLTATLNPLLTNVLYHYRAVATNIAGRATGQDRTFMWFRIKSATPQPNGNIDIRFSAAPGLVYSVWTTTDLVNWSMLGTATDLGSGQFSYLDATAGAPPRRFYQIRSP